MKMSDALLDKKLKFALRLWEMERSEFLELSKLNKEEASLVKRKLLSKSRTLKTDDKKAAELLLAINCVHTGVKETGYVEELRRYRCGTSPFHTFLSRVVLSFDGLYTLAFVKPEDRAVALGFLKQYRAFWTRDAKAPWGMIVGVADAEYIAELEEFLEQGGLGR
jgi:hypothetical protein